MDPVSLHTSLNEKEFIQSENIKDENIQNETIKSSIELQSIIVLPILPQEIIFYLFTFLPAKDLFSTITRCCKSWNEYVKSGKIFKSLNWKKNTASGMLFSKFRGQGRDCFDREKWNDAVVFFTRAIIFNPKDHLSYFWRAYSYAEMGQFHSALEDFSSSLELDPYDATTYSNRGATYRDIGQHEKAMEDLKIAIALDPESPSAHNNLGVVYGDLGRIEDALSEYSKAINIDPYHAIALRNRGRRYGKLRNDFMALSDFNRLLKINPKDTEGLRALVCYQIRGILGYEKPKVLVNHLKTWDYQDEETPEFKTIEKDK